MSEQGTTKDLVCKFKSGDIVRWNALALHGIDRDGWAIQGLETKHSLMPIYLVRRGRQTGSAVENELEKLDACEVCPEHVTTWVPGCPSCTWAQDAKRQREQHPSKDLCSQLRALPAGARLLGYTAAEEIEQLRTTLRGIQSCSTCEACRGAATRALGGATPEPAVTPSERLRRVAFELSDLAENCPRELNRSEIAKVAARMLSASAHVELGGRATSTTEAGQS